MGQLCCIPKKDKNNNYYKYQRVKPVDNLDVEERNSDNYYAVSRLPQLRKRRMSISEDSFEDYIYEKPIIQRIMINKNILNFRPFQEQDGANYQVNYGDY
jgi:hypothetical protein